MRLRLCIYSAAAVLSTVGVVAQDVNGTNSTTEEPSNTTTEEPSNTTTEELSNTTTEEPSNTTTAEVTVSPNTTTVAAGSNVTTTAVVTTTAGSNETTTAAVTTADPNATTTAAVTTSADPNATTTAAVTTTAGSNATTTAAVTSTAGSGNPNATTTIAESTSAGGDTTPAGGDTTPAAKAPAVTLAPTSAYCSAETYNFLGLEWKHGATAVSIPPGRDDQKVICTMRTTVPLAQDATGNSLYALMPADDGATTLAGCYGCDDLPASIPELVQQQGVVPYIAQYCCNEQPVQLTGASSSRTLAGTIDVGATFTRSFYTDDACQTSFSPPTTWPYSELPFTTSGTQVLDGQCATKRDLNGAYEKALLCNSSSVVVGYYLDAACAFPMTFGIESLKTACTADSSKTFSHGNVSLYYQSDCTGGAPPAEMSVEIVSTTAIDTEFTTPALACDFQTIYTDQTEAVMAGALTDYSGADIEYVHLFTGSLNTCVTRRRRSLTERMLTAHHSTATTSTIVTVSASAGTGFSSAQAAADAVQATVNQAAATTSTTLKINIEQAVASSTTLSNITITVESLQAHEPVIADLAGGSGPDTPAAPATTSSAVVRYAAGVSSLLAGALLLAF